MTEKCQLHFMRIRKCGEPDWFDPQTDVRRLVPMIMDMSLDALEASGDDRIVPDVLHIRDCWRIFRIHIAEDPARVSSLIDDFCRALNGTPPATLNALWATVSRALLCVWSLFCRRDTATDGEALKRMLGYTSIDALRNSLSETTRAKLDEELGSSASLLVQNRTEPEGRIVCVEDGKCLDYGKDIARRLVSASGDTSWDALSDACDRMFTEKGDKLGQLEGVALALAYPSYRNPYLEATVDGAQTEARNLDEPARADAVSVDPGQKQDGE